MRGREKEDSKSSPESPRTLYHYTNVEALKGIVRCGSLSATRGSFLNDKGEITYVLGKINEVLANRIAGAAIDETTRGFLERVKLYYAAPIPRDLYLVSFSQNQMI